jgi:glucose-1-phosphate thymidylyltransferase
VTQLEANRTVLDSLVTEPGPDVREEVDAVSDIAGKVLIEPGARIIQSQVRGPAIIGTDALVQQSYIGPYTSLGARCIVKNSEVEYGIICPGTQILDAHVRIERSLLAMK